MFTLVCFTQYNEKILFFNVSSSKMTHFLKKPQSYFWLNFSTKTELFPVGIEYMLCARHHYIIQLNLYKILVFWQTWSNGLMLLNNEVLFSQCCFAVSQKQHCETTSCKTICFQNNCVPCTRHRAVCHVKSLWTVSTSRSYPKQPKISDIENEK